MSDQWDYEPDHGDWIDEATDYRCIIVRTPLKHLCGYVGIPAGHPLHGKDYSDPNVYELDVHGGLTWADNVPGGKNTTPDGRWWFGFDCAHLGDLVPGIDRQAGAAFRGNVYRTFEYVKAECSSLATQLQAIELSQ